MTDVIICGGANNPPILKLKELLILNSEAVLVGVDRGTLMLLEHELKPSICFGDFDSVTIQELDYIKENVDKVNVYNSEKDDTDLEIALEWAVNHYTDANYHLFGCIGFEVGRLDHLLANIWLVFQPRFQSKMERMFIYHESNFIQYWLPGSHTLQPNKEFNYFSLIGLTSIDRMTIKGAKYTLNNQSFTFPKVNISNEFLNEEVRVNFENGYMMVIQSKEDNPKLNL